MPYLQGKRSTAVIHIRLLFISVQHLTKKTEESAQECLQVDFGAEDRMSLFRHHSTPKGKSTISNYYAAIVQEMIKFFFSCGRSHQTKTSTIEVCRSQNFSVLPCLVREAFGHANKFSLRYVWCNRLKPDLFVVCSLRSTVTIGTATRVAFNA